MRATGTIRAGDNKPAIRKPAARRIVPAALAALLLGAAGASVPGTVASAEMQSPAAVSNASVALLVPAKTQPSFGEAFAAYAPLPTQSAPAPAGPDLEAGPRFEDPGTPLGTGTASYYGREFAGHRTASGARFDPAGFTAAHRSLPFGSKLRVTNVKTGASVIVTVNDRGPFSRGRLIDVSQAAARELGLIGPGSGKVSISVLAD